jgi:hypothetical protein
MSHETLQLGPWSGLDAFHRGTHKVFQPQEQGLSALSLCQNVWLDDEGWPISVEQATQRVAATSGKSTFSGLGLLLEQDGTTIKQVYVNGWNPVVVVDSLTSGARVFFCEHARKIWWSNGTDYGVIDEDSANSHWGLARPPQPTLTSAPGSLPAGTYQVVCTVVDANGAESGCENAATITLASASGIKVNLLGSALDSNTLLVNIYAGSTNQEGLFWQKSVLPSAIPTVLSDVRTTKRPLYTQFRTGPPTGITSIVSFRGWLLLLRSNELFRSSGISHHLYLPIESEALPDDVLGAAGLEDGFWRVTSRGAWWTTGTDPTNWVTSKRDSLEYAAGSKVVSGSLVPALQTSALVALFVSEQGLMAGLPGGVMRPLTFDKLPLTVTSKRASFLII